MSEAPRELKSAAEFKRSQRGFFSLSTAVRCGNLGQRFVARIAKDQGPERSANLPALIRRRTPTPRISRAGVELQPPQWRQALDRGGEPHIAICALIRRRR